MLIVPSSLAAAFALVAGIAPAPTALPDLGDPLPPSAVGQAEPAATLDPWVADRLALVERGGEGLESIRANVVYRTEDGVLGDVAVRRGRLIYRAGDAQHRALAILFDALIVGDRRREQRKHYVFADRWLVEVDHEQKLVQKYEVARPGESFDPFRLGEGPIPLPIGQSRDAVLARFDVSRAELPADGPLARLADRPGLFGLRLVPHAGSREARDIAHVDLFYDETTMLPVGVDLLDPGGSRKTARLDDLERNPALDDADAARLVIDEFDPSVWRIDVRPLEPR